jgi:hypothetical protein
MVAPSRPGSPIGRGKQRIHLRSAQKWNQSAGETLGWNGKHALDLCRTCRVLERHLPAAAA